MATTTNRGDDGDVVTTVKQTTRRSYGRLSPIRFFFLTMVVACMISLKLSPSMISLESPETRSVKPQHNMSPPEPAVVVVESPPPAQLYNISNIPKWMLDYFKWHRTQLEKLHAGELSWTAEYVTVLDEDVSDNENSTNNTNSTMDIQKVTAKAPKPPAVTSPRFLILRCIAGDRCGGTSDRLKASPLFIFMAKQSRRILLIRWGRNRPFPIEKFLRPTSLWNWTVPEPLLRILEARDEAKAGQGNNNAINTNNTEVDTGRRVYYDGTQFKYLRRSSLDSKIWLVEGNDYSGGETRYQRLMTLELGRQQQQNNSDWKVQDREYANFYHDLFHASFRPSMAIEEQLLAYVDKSDGHESSRSPMESSLPIRLRPNDYMVAHYRAKYPGEPYRQTWNVTILEERALHAVDCARQRGPSILSTVYVASDTALALEVVHKAYDKQNEEPDQASIHVWSYLNLQASDKTDNSNMSQPSQLAVDPPHLNFAKLNDASGFYGIFVDLFLMSYSHCVVYGAGGFGRFGALVSFHPHCGTPFTHQNAALRECKPYRDN